MIEDTTVLTAKGVTASAATLLRLGVITSAPGGGYLTTEPSPKVPIVAPEATPIETRRDPWSLLALEARGYRVKPGKTPAGDRIQLLGVWIRIEAARHNKLISENESKQ